MQKEVEEEEKLTLKSKSRRGEPVAEEQIHFGMRDMFLMSFSLDHRLLLRDEPNETDTQRKSSSHTHICIYIFDSAGHERKFLFYLYFF
jgi:hypothetical protein